MFDSFCIWSNKTWQRCQVQLLVRVTPFAGHIQNPEPFLPRKGRGTLKAAVVQTACRQPGRKRASCFTYFQGYFITQNCHHCLQHEERIFRSEKICHLSLYACRYQSTGRFCIVGLYEELYYIKNQQDATLAVSFFTHCKITLHVSDAFCVHLQEY